MSDNNLDVLIVKISEGSNDSFAQFYQLTIKGAFVFAYSYLKEKTIAEDICHDAYIQLKQKAHTYKSGTNAKAWFLQIVKNLCLDELRKRKRSSSNEEYEVALKTEVYEQEDFTSATEYMLNALTDEERQIVIMHVFWGYKHREIATELNLPLGTILWRYNGAIKKLKKYKEDL